MNYEHKSNLKKALISQTWNKPLAGAVINAIEEDLKQPKKKAEPSILQLAVEKEKSKSVKSFPVINDNSDE